MPSDLNFAADLAHNVGGMLMNRFEVSGTTARLKRDRSLVTEADLSAEREIKVAIKTQYPNDQILSEEHETSLAEISHRVWVVDPLDGTTNFSLGLHIWGVSIALVIDGWPAIGALYFPALEETYTVQYGQGAFLNGKPIRVKPPDPKQPVAFFACCSRTFRNYNVEIPYKPRILGSATYNLCAVARGSALLAFEATPKLWDLAAGWLLLREAGGFVEVFDPPPPFPLQADRDYDGMNIPTLAAATPKLAMIARTQIHQRIASS